MNKKFEILPTYPNRRWGNRETMNSPWENMASDISKSNKEQIKL